MNICEFCNAFPFWKYACSTHINIFNIFQFADPWKFSHGNMDSCTNSLNYSYLAIRLIFIPTFCRSHSKTFFTVDLQKVWHLMLKLRSYSGHKQTSKDLGCIYLSTMSLNVYQNFLCLKFWGKNWLSLFNWLTNIRENFISLFFFLYYKIH